MGFFQRMKNRGKVYYTNLFLTVILISAMVVLLFIYVFISNSKYINSQVKNSENEYLEYYNAYAGTELDRLCMLVINLSTAVLEPEFESGSNRSSIEYEVVKSHMNQNISILGISLTYDNENLTVGTVSEEFTQKINTYKNVDFYCDADYSWPANLQLVYNNNRNDTTKVIIEISLRKFGGVLNDNTADAENREFYLTTGDGIILSSDDMSRIFTNLNEYIPQFKPLDDSIKQIKNDNKDYFLITKKAKISGLYVISFVDSSVYRTNIQQNTVLVCMLGIVFLAVSVIVSYVISTNTYKPIRKIMESLSSKLPDDVSALGSEVVLINTKIKELLDNNDELKQTLSSKIETLKQIQLMALQSQINPHFLYNTLDSLRWMSIDMLGDDNPIEKSLVDINDIYKASVDYKINLIPLREEVELSKSYVEIMLLRFGSSFDVEWCINDSVLEFKVLRFILQPLIENSFVHGKRRNGKTIITVKADIENTRLRLEVSDNGCGMDEHTLKSLKSDFDENNIIDVHHIGTGNINMRLRLLYGTHYTFEIISEIDSGTKCIITIDKENLK